jgi:hypothetical protein
MHTNVVIRVVVGACRYRGAIFAGAFINSPNARPGGNRTINSQDGQSVLGRRYGRNGLVMASMSGRVVFCSITEKTNAAAGASAKKNN